MNDASTHAPEFLTSDFSMAAYLCCLGYTICDAEMDTGSMRYQWVFDDSDGLRKDVLAFHNREATVEPKIFSEHRDRLRKEMFAARNEVEGQLNRRG